MSSDADNGPYYHVPALDKGLDVLECLAAHGIAMTQSQIARGLERRPTELFRILTTLERRGYIVRDPVSGAYDLTLRLFELAHSHSPYEELVRAADRPMRALSDLIRQGCHLSVIDRGKLLVLHRVESPARVRVSIAVGSTISLADSASGRLLLAYSNEPGWDDERLERIRERGFEEAYSDTIEGVADLAVLVGHPDSRMKAALTIAALPRDREAFVRETYEPMRQCAAAIARAAGLLGEKG
jgi:DNA-binding IclR family transcriptional regulator